MNKSTLWLGALLVTACGEPSEQTSDTNRPDLSDLLDAGPASTPDAGASADAGVAPSDAGSSPIDAGGNVEPDAGPPAPVATEQRYAMKAVSAVQQRNPSPLGNEEVRVTTTQYVLLESERLEEDFSWTETLCSIATSEARYRFGIRASTSYPAAFVDHFPTFERTGTWTEAGEFSAGPMASVVGAELANPLRDPLPTEPGAGGESDSDEDGHPGVTVNVGGAVSGSVYVAQRSIISLRGRERDGGRIEGLWQSNDEQVVLGASSGILNRQVERRRDPEDAASFFIMTPIDDAWDCDDITARIDELF